MLAPSSFRGDITHRKLMVPFFVVSDRREYFSIMDLFLCSQLRGCTRKTVSGKKNTFDIL